MEQLKSCKICGRLLQSSENVNVCTNCVEQDEIDYSRIREYLILHPRASIYEVATVLGVSISRIKCYLREGRIEIVENDNNFLDCEICGVAIHSGKYCSECSKHASHDYKSTYVGNSNSKQTTKTDKPTSELEFKINFLLKNYNKK